MEVMASERNGQTLSDLPDNILTIIFSKFSLKEAVRCSVVSKDWKFLWTFSENLRFYRDFFSRSCSVHKRERIIDHIFRAHSGEIKCFEFINYWSCRSEKILDWIHQAALKNVQEINIEERDSSPSEIQVPATVFLCQKLKSLVLNNFLLTNMPDGFAGFPSLTTLELCRVKLKDEIIELMLQLCPGLQNLTLQRCSGIKRLKICSDKLISLNLSFNRVEAITAYCPRLTSFKMDGIGLHIDEIEMEYYFPTCLSLCTDAPLKSFRALKTLKKLTALNWCLFPKDVMILKNFPDLEQMCVVGVGLFHPQICSRGHDEEEILTLKNLKLVHLHVYGFDDPIPLLAFFLKMAPAMKTLLISRENGFNGIEGRRYVNLVMNHPQREETKIILSQNQLREMGCVVGDLSEHVT